MKNVGGDGASGVGSHNRKDPSTTLQQAENRDFASNSSTTFAFSESSEIALFDLSLTVEWRCLLHLNGNDFPQPCEEHGRRVFGHPKSKRCA